MYRTIRSTPYCKNTEPITSHAKNRPPALHWVSRERYGACCVPSRANRAPFPAGRSTSCHCSPHRTRRRRKQATRPAVAAIATPLLARPDQPRPANAVVNSTGETSTRYDAVGAAEPKRSGESRPISLLGLVVFLLPDPKRGRFPVVSN